MDRLPVHDKDTWTGHRSMTGTPEQVSSLSQGYLDRSADDAATTVLFCGDGDLSGMKLVRFASDLNEAKVQYSLS